MVENLNSENAQNFVHLHVHSDYSILDGAAKLSALVEKAKSLNMNALALTDHGNMFGALNFERLCSENGIKPIIGEEFYVAYGSHLEKIDAPYSKNGKKIHYFHLILLCQNDVGYKNMCKLSSLAYTEGLYYKKPRIDFELLKKYNEGLICLSACIQGEIPQLLLNKMNDEAEKIALEYKNLFNGGRYFFELQNHGMNEQIKVAEKLVALAKKLEIPLVLTNDVHYIEKEDAEAQDVLRCIDFQQKLYEPHQTMGEGRTEWYFKNATEMQKVLQGISGIDENVITEAMENTQKIAKMCSLKIKKYETQELKNTLPRFELPAEFCTHGENYQANQNDYVRFLVEKGLTERYEKITEEIRSRVEHELQTIFSMGFSGYFLIVWEFINWARKNSIPIGPGRGSGAGSIVAYCMKITDIDPLRFGLIFERFLNPERVSMPDFDVDMDYDFRQDIIQHTRDLYGENQVGHIVTFGTLKPKLCISDVGRVLGIPLSEVNELKKCIPENPKAKLEDAFTPPNSEHPENGKLIPYKDDPRYQKLFELARKLEGTIRNTGIHASGMVIGLTELSDWAPVFMDKNEEVGVQYTMDVIEPCGLVKFDYLGLKTLSLIRYAETIINKHKKPSEPIFSTQNISETDEKTFDLFRRGDTVAVFQFESPGMQKYLRQLKPTCLADLVAMNALYRPGPMQYIDDFIRGKNNPASVVYADECLKDILEETYGVMVYQEQVMQAARRIAGFSLGAADELRRAMGKKKIEKLIHTRQAFINGAIKNGFSEKKANEIFEMMIPFAGYGFNKSHAAAYTILAYRTAWLKANRAAEFMAANLTNEINSADKLPQYIEEARNMGLCVDPPDVNRSDVIFDVVDGRIVFGLMGIKGMGEVSAKIIIEERKKNGEYKSFQDFIARIDLKALGKKPIEVLIKTGAFDHVGEKEGKNLNRKTLLANFVEAIKFQERINDEKLQGGIGLFDDTEEKLFVDYNYEIQEDMPRAEKLELEKDLIGCYVSGHPLDDWHDVIEKCATISSKNILKIAQFESSQKSSELNYKSDYKNRNPKKNYTAIGLVVELKPYVTQKGQEMAWAKLQDFHGIIDLTFFAKTWETLKNQVCENKVLAFSGKLEMRGENPQMIVDRLEDLNTLTKKSKKELHILLNPIQSENDFLDLKEFLYSGNGQCTIFIHIQNNGEEFVIRAALSLTANANPQTIKTISQFSCVREVWTA